MHPRAESPTGSGGIVLIEYCEFWNSWLGDVFSQEKNSNFFYTIPELIPENQYYDESPKFKQVFPHDTL
jgi:hypothetical protein